ncbi:hypothetical protein CP970_02270 [Streptomyces kanamyceticus]|uniref:PKS/mFAS DH domain-containing protein n=1 Tax=Streptomyces kanamyceticus TaxID=1967 RepID=A0A5J6G2W6_STRKN|nr:hypothetical protein CP970_02270 [Streptomyces kanamyceticus]
MTEPVDDDYWYRNLRQPVAMDTATGELDGSLFIECSAHPVLLPALDQERTVASLRTDDGGWERFLTALAEAWTQGADVDWTTLIEPAQHRVLDLPTYPFDHKRYWLQPAPAGGAGIGHPFLSSAAVLPGSDGVLLTGKLSLATHPWLADHAVQDTVLLPGTAFLELVVRAGDEVGCDTIDELVIETPLVLPVTGAVDLTVTVDQPDTTGHRPVSVHARPEGTDTWTRHVTGTLTTSATDTTPAPNSFPQWPPTGAQPASLDQFYEQLAAAGYTYGPAFQGLRAAWRAGDTIYAEVALPEDRAADVDRFGVHPALLDAALHAGRLDAGDELELPFSWTGVRLHATGATAVRVALTRGPAGVAVQVADPDGRPVVSVDALVLRPRSATPSGPNLLGLEWLPVAEAHYDGADSLPEGYTLITATHPDDPEDDPTNPHSTPTRTHTQTTRVLAALQHHLTTTNHTLIIHTTTDPPGAAVTGLTRTAQNEHPGRIHLIETHHPHTPLPLTQLTTLNQPHLRLTNNTLHTPHLTPLTPRTNPNPNPNPTTPQHPPHPSTPTTPSSSPAAPAPSPESSPATSTTPHLPPLPHPTTPHHTRHPHPLRPHRPHPNHPRPQPDTPTPHRHLPHRRHPRRHPPAHPHPPTPHHRPPTQSRRRLAPPPPHPKPTPHPLRPLLQRRRHPRQPRPSQLRRRQRLPRRPRHPPPHPQPTRHHHRLGHVAHHHHTHRATRRHRTAAGAGRFPSAHRGRGQPLPRCEPRHRRAVRGRGDSRRARSSAGRASYRPYR